MTISVNNPTAKRLQADYVGSASTLAAARTPRPAASFDGGLVF